MLSNHGYFMSGTLAECCQNFYQWDYYSCTGTTPTLTNGDFYPNWSGGDNTCVNDGNYPEYMLSYQSWYLSPSLQDCCQRFYHWKLDDCLSTSSAPTYQPSALPSISNQPSGEPTASPSLSSSPSANPTIPPSIILADSYQPTGKWYPDWETYTCVQDCEGAPPCGGAAEFWDDLYSSRDECCSTRLSWNMDKCMGN